MGMKRVHISTITKWNPCIDPLTKVSSDWEGTALDVLALNNITAFDKLWVVLRSEFLSDKTLRLFAVSCARSVEHLLTDERSKKAIEIAERYAHGEASDAELAAARAAAREATWAAELGTAWAAAAAAEAAAAAAAWEAAAPAATTRKQQVEMLIELIKKHEVET